MNQGFKSKFDEMRQGNPADKEAQKTENQSFSDIGHVRNLCFVWPDGKKKFLNYAYLVSGDYSPKDSMVTLIFTSETVKIKGSSLDKLFDQLLGHITKQIVCVEPRYSQIATNEFYVVTEIICEGTE